MTTEFTLNFYTLRSKIPFEKTLISSLGNLPVHVGLSLTLAHSEAKIQGTIKEFRIKINAYNRLTVSNTRKTCEFVQTLMPSLEN